MVDDDVVAIGWKMPMTMNQLMTRSLQEVRCRAAAAGDEALSSYFLIFIYQLMSRSRESIDPPTTQP
jgi:hypothetical protein